MSSRKSKNCNLHLWDPDDSFQRTEFNENFETLDALKAQWNADLAAARKALEDAKTQLNDSIAQNVAALNASIAQVSTAAAAKSATVMGTYVGNSEGMNQPKQLVHLGRRPKAVFIWDNIKYTDRDIYAPLHSMAVDGCVGCGIEIVDEGFWAWQYIDYSNLYYPNLNSKGTTYMYIAFF